MTHDPLIWIEGNAQEGGREEIGETSDFQTDLRQKGMKEARNTNDDHNATKMRKEEKVHHEGIHREMGKVRARPT